MATTTCKYVVHSPKSDIAPVTTHDRDVAFRLAESYAPLTAHVTVLEMYGGKYEPHAFWKHQCGEWLVL